jgi:2-methylcitrate dehydratase PrpD
LVRWCAINGEFLMRTFIEQLGDFAVTVDRADIPRTVLERARLQHIHLAGLVADVVPNEIASGLRKGAPRRGAASVWGGGKTSPRTAARIHAARAAFVDRLDHVLGGSTGVGAVSSSWAFAKGAQVDEVLVATAVANEVAGRVGAALLIGPHHGFGSGWVHAVAAAVSTGRLLQLDAGQMSHAIGLALASSGPIPRTVLAGAGRSAAVAAAVASGIEAAQLAAKGTQSSLNQLEAPGGLLESACWIPLKHAFTGLGQAWLTHTLSFPRWPGPVVWHSTYDALDKVLKRHVKAADKRLRVDQVSEIHLRVPAPAVALDQWAARTGLQESAGLPHAVRHGIGALVAEHQLGAHEMNPADWSKRSAIYGDVASRIRVRHDLSLTLDFMGQVVDTISPLVGGITETEWKGLMGRVSRPEVGWPTVQWGDLRSLWKHRPDKWFHTVRFAPGNLSDARLDEWQLRLGAEIEVYTTRGGKWPERRSVPEHSPGTPWLETIASVHDRFAAGEEKRMEQAQWVWDSGGEHDAVEWVSKLLE